MAIKIKTSSSGFSLIELMAAVAIIAIISAIAVPMYNNYVTVGRTSECTNEVAKIKIALVEYNARTFTYPVAANINAIAIELAPDGYTPSSRIVGPGSNCAISIAAGVGPNTYVITVVGQNELLGIPNIVMAGP